MTKVRLDTTVLPIIHLDLEQMVIQICIRKRMQWFINQTETCVVEKLPQRQDLDRIFAGLSSKIENRASLFVSD